MMIMVSEVEFSEVRCLPVRSRRAVAARGLPLMLAIPAVAATNKELARSDKHQPLPSAT